MSKFQYVAFFSGYMSKQAEDLYPNPVTSTDQANMKNELTNLQNESAKNNTMFGKVKATIGQMPNVFKDYAKGFGQGIKNVMLGSSSFAPATAIKDSRSALTKELNS